MHSVHVTSPFFSSDFRTIDVQCIWGSQFFPQKRTSACSSSESVRHIVSCAMLPSLILVTTSASGRSVLVQNIYSDCNLCDGIYIVRHTLRISLAVLYVTYKNIRHRRAVKVPKVASLQAREPPRRELRSEFQSLGLTELKDLSPTVFKSKVSGP